MASFSAGAAPAVTSFISASFLGVAEDYGYGEIAYAALQDAAVAIAQTSFEELEAIVAIRTDRSLTRAEKESRLAEYNVDTLSMALTLYGYGRLGHRSCRTGRHTWGGG